MAAARAAADLSDAAQALDRLAIRDLIYAYARGVDRRDLDAVRACFTPDCRYEGTLASGTIADMLRALPAAMARYERTMHFMGEPSVTVDGDQAWSETPTVAYHVLRDAPHGLRTVHVVYADVLARTAVGWRIVERRVRALADRTRA
jgi:3-phenylpropionate/cinnamic acid dioxygenase small subunit